MAFIDEVQNDLPALRDAPQKYKDTCNEVSDFLQNKRSVMGASIRLERALVDEIKARKGSFLLLDSDRKATLLESLRTPFKPNAMTDARWQELQNMKPYTTHILSNVLSRSELEHGFTVFEKKGREHGQVITLLTFIEPEKFRSIIQGRMMWKDPGAGADHGEFTHRIQWNMIMNSINKAEGFWNDFYSWIGTIKENSSRGQTPTNEGGFVDLVFGLWDALFDRLPNIYPPKSTEDFRSPENLLAFLLSDANEQNKLLKAFLFGRKLKRNDPAGKYPDKLKVVNDYLQSGKILAKKVFGLDLAQLPEDYAREFAKGLMANEPLPDTLVPVQIEADADSQGENHFMYELRQVLKQDVV